MDTFNRILNLENQPANNEVYGRIFCVKCGRPASGDGQNYQCSGGHWIKCKGPKTQTLNAPSSWEAANIINPQIEFKILADQIFCLKCGRVMSITNNMCYDGQFYQIVYACKCGYTMDLKPE